MFAIFEALGRQYKVSVGDKIKVDRVSQEKNDVALGTKITFDQILLVGDNADIKVGKPFLSGATIVGTIAEQGKEKKVTAFKKKRRKGYMRKVGHRRAFTVIEIKEIKAA